MSTHTGPVREGPARVGIVGAGVISDQYLSTLAETPDVDVRSIADLDLERARAQADAHEVPAAVRPEELYADDEVELVVDLTIPAAHVEVGLAALRAGKHVWSEKPLALHPEGGRELIAEGARRGLRVACAPDTLLGAGLQTAQRIVDAGRIGRPISALALMQTVGPELWHPNPDFLYRAGAGPLFDLGPYFLTALVQLLGPIGRVQATSDTSRTRRTIASGPRAGTEFDVTVPSQHSALLEFAGGATAVLVAGFESHDERALLEVTGTEGTLRAPDPRFFDGASTLVTDDGPTTIPAEGARLGRGIGVVELARAIRSGAPERADGALALHVLDAMTSIAEAAASARPVDLSTTCERPVILPDGWDPAASTLGSR